MLSSSSHLISLHFKEYCTRLCPQSQFFVLIKENHRHNRGKKLRHRHRQLPPVANMVLSPTISLITGHTILRTDRALVPANRATKIVSTIVCTPINSIVTIVGNANFNSDVMSKSCDRGFSAYSWNGKFPKGGGQIGLYAVYGNISNKTA